MDKNMMDTSELKQVDCTECHTDAIAFVVPGYSKAVQCFCGKVVSLDADGNETEPELNAYVTGIS